MANQAPKIVVSRDGEVTIVELLDEEILEEVTINLVSDSLFSVVMENPGLKLLLCFSRVKHFSSSALGMLIRLNKRVEENGGQLKLCRIQPALYEIFVITKLNKLFDIYQEKNEALGDFAK